MKYFGIEPTTQGPQHPKRVDPFTLFCYRENNIVHRYPMTLDDVINLGIALNLFYEEHLAEEIQNEVNERVKEAMMFHHVAAEL
ncbi:hypothetical protein [Streptomyces sp. NBC_00470]|uniref:hypothetical protein n=1 Tax=Streptomyces sp. NBC_00470 TaxID=2975753 RepID=UPI0030DE44A0